MEKPRRRPLSSALVLLSAAVLCVGAARAQTTTHMTGNLRDPLNGALTASCTFRAGAVFTAASGVIVPGTSAPRTVAITGGTLAVDLVPTDTGAPTTYYELRCHYPLQTAAGQNCEGRQSLVSQGLCVVGAGDMGPLYVDVPTSGSPVDIKDHYRTARPPAPPLLIAVSQLDTRALAAGRYCIVVDSHGTASLTQTNCPGSGGSGSPANGMTWNGSPMTWNGSTMTWN